MRWLVTHAALGALLVAFAGFAVLTGWQPSPAAPRTLPASVRDNPGSSRPIYTVYRVPSPAGGGGYSPGK